jgi:DedD protein
MDSPLKQRLVGALILMALGVVFWPIIFVAPEEAPLRARSVAPPPPVVDTSPLPAPDAEGLRGSPARQASLEPVPDVRLPEDAPEPERSAAGETNPPPPAETPPIPVPTAADPFPTREQAPVVADFDQDGLPVAWVLQVATVSSVDKARRLRDDLIASDEKAFYDPLDRDGDTLYRVFVGPKFERAQLGPVKARVDARYGVDSLVARYVP